MASPDVELTGNVAGAIVASTNMERANVYGLLATILRRPLSPATLRALRQPDLLECLRDAGADPGENFGRLPEDELLHDLAVDYTQLFHGPRGHVSAYESVQRGRDGGSLNGPAARLVRQSLDTNGFELNEECNELPDHIAVELEMMSALLSREAGAWRKTDTVAALRCRGEQRTFFDSHLGSWGQEFGRQIQEKAETVFYRVAGKLLADFIGLERSELHSSSEDSVAFRDEETSQQGS